MNERICIYIIREEERVSPNLGLLIFHNDHTNCMCTRIKPNIYKSNREKVNQLVVGKVRIFNQLSARRNEDRHSSVRKRFSPHSLK